MDDYLEDFKYELTPKTYKARNKPQWLVKQLMERDEQVGCNVIFLFDVHSAL